MSSAKGRPGVWRCRLCCVAMLLVLAACSRPPEADDPAARSTVGRAVAATATALAGQAAVSPAGAAASPTAAATAAPRGTPVATAMATRGFSQEEELYLTGVVRLILLFNGSFTHFRELLAQPRVEDAQWREALSAELTLWATGADLARDVQAPPVFAGVHQRIMNGLDLYQASAQQIAGAIQTSDQTQMRQALDRALQARQSFAEAQTEIERLVWERQR